MCIKSHQPADNYSNNNNNTNQIFVKHHTNVDIILDIDAQKAMVQLPEKILVHINVR